MDKPRLVRFREVFSEELEREPVSERDHRLLHQQFLTQVDELIDDSLQFIEEELSRMGIEANQIELFKERVEYGLLSVWVQWLLEKDITLGISDLDYRSDEKSSAAYFQQRFRRTLR